MENKAEKLANELIKTYNLQPLPESKVNGILESFAHGCLYCKILTDERGQPTDYTVIGCNKAMQRITGSVLAGNLEQLVKDFFSTTELLPTLAKAALYGIPSTWEQFFEGRQKWYTLSVFSLERDYAVLLLEDITAKKLLEKELTANKTRYEALVKQSSDAIVIVDAVSKKIMEANLNLCQMTGYTEQELCQLSLYELFADQHTKIDDCQTELVRQNYLPVANRKIKRKDGTVLEVERVVSLVNYNGQQLELLTLYDVSEERKLQQIINEEAAVASKVQRQMLPADYRHKTFELKGIYKPLHMVSGDFYDYRLTEDQSVLTGFLLDVAGHGLATALRTAAINVLLQDVIMQERMPTEEELRMLNKQMMGYFDEGTFGALVLFHFDFPQKTLTCAFCGINKILAFHGGKEGWLKAKGSIIGAFDEPQFDLVKVPIRAGDCFYFLTDGFSDKLTDDVVENLADFSATVARLADLARSPEIRDDCSAVCIKLNKAFTGCHYVFSGLDDVTAMQEKLRDTLRELAGNRAFHLEIALNEAINNVLFHGSGQGYVKIKPIGRQLALRVKDYNQGFDAKGVLGQFATKTPAEIADAVSARETGRGLLIMKLFTDKIYYNQKGDEVMLVYKGDKSEHFQDTRFKSLKKPRIARVS